MTVPDGELRRLRRPTRAGCLNPLNAVGRLAWLCLLSGAGFAGTVWPGGLPGWCFKAAMFIWILTGITVAFWLFVVGQALLAFRRMRKQAEDLWRRAAERGDPEA